MGRRLLVSKQNMEEAERGATIALCRRVVTILKEQGKDSPGVIRHCLLVPGAFDEELNLKAEFEWVALHDPLVE